MTVCPQNSTDILQKESARFLAQNTNVDSLKFATGGGVALLLTIHRTIELFIDNTGKEYHNKSPWKKWGSMYYSGLILRPSCYECKFIKPAARVGDITLSDIPMALCESADFPHEKENMEAH